MRFISREVILILTLAVCTAAAGSKSNGTNNGTSSTTTTTSTTVKTTYTTRDLIRDLIISLTSDGSSNSTSSLKPLNRDVKASTSTVSLLSYGNLAILGAVVLGGLAYAVPAFIPEYRRRAGPPGPMVPQMHPVYPNRFFDSISDFSADMIPYIENEIQQQGHFYKRNKRAISSGNSVNGGGLTNNGVGEETKERLDLLHILSKRFTAVSESVMVWVERTLDNLPNLPRLEAQSCMKRCICEAHNQPKKYGLTGLVLQLFFPPYIESDTPSKIISKYQLAARYGRTENANCGQQYDDCIINFLDIVKSVTNLLL